MLSRKKKNSKYLIKLEDARWKASSSVTNALMLTSDFFTVRWRDKIREFAVKNFLEKETEAVIG